MKQLLYATTLIALFVGLNTLANAQTIADLARQERLKRQAATTTIVVNNTNLKSDPMAAKIGTASVPPLLETPAAATADGRDEKWWREQFTKARTEVQKLENQIPLLETSLNTANREFLTRSYDPDGRGQKGINDAKTKLETAKTDLAKAKTKLSQLEDDLRRSGSPAGWAR